MRRDYGPECTRELVEAVARQLATRSVRDSEFPDASGIEEDDTIAILQNGVNKKVSAEVLANFLDSFLEIDAAKEKLEDLNIQYNTTAYWNSKRGFVPREGEIIIYSDSHQMVVNGKTIYVPGIKIGSGNGYVQDLAFVGDCEASRLMNHIADATVHTTAAEKAFWNRKLNVTDNSEVVDGMLIFNRN